MECELFVAFCHFPSSTRILCCSFTSHFVPCTLPVFTYLHGEDAFYIQILFLHSLSKQNIWVVFLFFFFLPVLLNISARVAVSFLSCNHISDNQVLHSASDKYKLISLVCHPARSLWVILCGHFPLAGFFMLCYPPEKPCSSFFVPPRVMPLS